jgi:arabinogalactan oligomer / maltooligosaccharide transport system substrate-binding protein
VFRSDVSWTPLFASKGYLLNLDPYVSQSDLADFMNAPLGTTLGIPPSTTSGIGPVRSAPLVYDEYNGDLYGLPQVIDFPALLFNWKELQKAGITSAPSTMDEFENDAVEIVRRGAAEYGFEFGGTSYDALPFLYACGGGMFDQNDNILVNNTGSVAGLNFLVNLQKVGKTQVMPREPRFSAPPGTMVKDFMNGMTAMIFDGPSDLKDILTGSAFKHDPGNLGIAPIPTGPAGQTGSPLGGQSYVISASTAHPAEAYKFIQFMDMTSSQVFIAQKNHTLPTRLSAYQDNGVSSDPYISAFLSYKDIVVAPPPIPQAAYLFDAADPDIWSALYGEQSADEALNEIAYSWQQLGTGKFTSAPGTPPAAC